MATKTNFRVDHVSKTITLNRGYYVKTQNPNNLEAKEFEKILQQHVGYDVNVRQPIKSNKNKRTYKGVNYENIEKYILSHDNATERMHDYLQLRDAGAFHKNAYAVIKKWFLSKYPEVENFGMLDDEQIADDEQPEAAEPQTPTLKIANF